MRKELINKLEQEGVLSRQEFEFLLKGYTKEDVQYANEKAGKIRDEVFGKNVYIRGLIEFTNFCKNNCFYCGIRNGNEKVTRYRLTTEQVLSCCKQGYDLGFRTFVLQGGEDEEMEDERLVELVAAIRQEYPDCAITLSLGERTRESYEKLYRAGVNRYLLRHETADERHYQKLHPRDMSLVNRKQCLKDLKEIGYQTGCGFMVGTFGQTEKELAKDLLFIYELQPQMVGIGPFLPHKDTPFGMFPPGQLELTLYLLSLVRIMKKNVLLPATTALATLHEDGRKLGILAGANVVMPNLSPNEVRENYSLYNGKKHTGSESAQTLQQLEKEMASIGYHIDKSRGDYAKL